VAPQKTASIAGNSVGVITKHYANLDAEQCRDAVANISFGLTSASGVPRFRQKRNAIKPVKALWRIEMKGAGIEPATNGLKIRCSTY
jgi:hypothetical protein